MTVAGGLLIAFVDGAPLTGARDVHALFYAKMVATPRAHAAFTGRLCAIPLVPHPDASADRFTGVDVVASIAAAGRFEDAGTVAASRARSTPIDVRLRRKDRRIGAVLVPLAGGPRRGHAVVTDETVLR